MAEHVMQRVANFLNLPNEVVRRKNLMKAGDVYPLGQRSIHCARVPPFYHKLFINYRHLVTRLDLFQGPIKPTGEPHRCDTPFNLTPMWDQIMESSDYAKRRVNATKFNAEHKYKKRGLAVIPTGYSVGYECKWMNHGHAYVLIYEDGSVHVHHGGIEMGQGLHTKMLQVAAETLGIPIEYIHTNETTTDNIANTQATSGKQYLFSTYRL